ncbi:MAG: hypothetical protein D6681_10895 [Calditrichaeota bacterium]|nr:MAG: hypothetical protein D6681_10895 [Calditrichota bacterium]
MPLSHETFRLGEELVNDSTIVVQGPDSLLYLSVEGALDTIELSSSDFALEGIDTTQSFELGTLEINSLEVLSTGLISLGTLFPDLSNLIANGDSTYFTISDTTLTPDPVELDAGDFVGLHVVQGSLRIRLVNNLPFPLGPNAAHPEGVQVIVTDSTGQPVVQLAFNQTIASGQEVEQATPFGEGQMWIYSPLRVEYLIPVAQSTTFLVNNTVLDTAGIEIGVTLENIQADEVIARIESQEVEDTLAFSPGGKYRLREAVMDGGQIQLEFTNHTPINSRVVFTIPNLLTPDNRAYSDSIVVASGQVTSFSLPLEGMRLAHPTHPGELIDSLRIYYRTVTEAASDLLHLRSTDSVSVHVVLDSLIFRSFSGYIVADTLEIEPFVQEDLMDYSDFPTGLRLSEVDLNLSLSNEVFIENMSFDLEIVGYHRDEDGVITDSARVLLLDQQILPGQPGAPQVTHISLSGTEVADLLNILPTDIRTSGSIRVSGNVEIDRSSRVAGSYLISTPMRFRIEQAATVTGDVHTLREEDIDQALRDAADENLVEANLTLRLENGTPLGGRLWLIVSADQAHTDIYDTTYFNPQLEFTREIAVLPAPVDPTTGYVTRGQTNEIVLSLTRKEFRLFKYAPLRIGYELRIDQTEGEVALRGGDFVSVSGMSQVLVNIKDR